MIALIETVAYLVFWLCMGSFALFAVFNLLDYAAQILTYIVVLIYHKIKLDTWIKYDTFVSDWNEMKRKV